MREEILTVTKRFDDFTPAEREAQQRHEETIKYAEYQQYYRRIAEPTKQQDCAGYVLEKLWLPGQRYFVEADDFYDKVVAPFGEPISITSLWGDLTWKGDVHAGDIVVYTTEQGPSHVTFVVGAPRVGPMTVVQTETKDGPESVFYHVLGDIFQISRWLSNDPLIRSHGSPAIWRVDPKKVRIVSVSLDDCDPPTSGQGRTDAGPAAAGNYVLVKREGLGEGTFDPRVTIVVAGNTAHYMIPAGEFAGWDIALHWEDPTPTAEPNVVAIALRRQLYTSAFGTVGARLFISMLVLHPDGQWRDATLAVPEYRGAEAGTGVPGDQRTNRFLLHDFAEIKLGLHITGSFGGQQQLAVYHFRKQQGPPL